MQGKDAYEQVQGVWLMEVGELDSMKKAEATTVKQFITKQKDRFRPAYGRRTQEYPRQCVFFGTTNESQFLRDSTGNRRFWVVDTPNSADRQMLPALRDLDAATVRLIWGEAVELYKAGETLYLPPELERAAREVQELYAEENPLVGTIEDYLERLLPEGWENMDLYTRRQWLETDAVGTIRRTTVCAKEIWAEAMGKSPSQLDRYAGRDIHSAMACISGWGYQGSKLRTCRPYGRQRYYIRKDTENGD